MIAICETMVKQKATGLVLDINLVPTNLTDYEMDVLKKAVINYDKLKRDQKIQVPAAEAYIAGQSSMLEAPADPIVQLAFETFRSSLNAYATGSLFLQSVRALSNSAAAVEAVVVTMARNASREYNYELLSSDQKDEFVPATIAFQHCNISSRTRDNAIWDRPDAPTPFRRLHRLVGSAEASSFFRMPIPTDEGVPGFRTMNSRKETGPSALRRDDAAASVDIGRIMLRGIPLPEETVLIPVKQFCKHSLIVGVPGSGKTTCVFNILWQLWTRFRIPFLVLELAKTEYRKLLALPEMQDLLVFSLGNHQISPFIFNPLNVLPGITLERHFSGLEECFRSALRGLEGPAPFILREALEQAYRSKGWAMEDVGERHSAKDTPTIHDVKQALEEIIPQKGYKGEIESNIKAALTLRMEYFANRRMSIGRMLNNAGTIPADVLFTRPVILELESLNEETKALMAMFILNLLREYSSVRSPQSNDYGLRHLVVLEEAHNLLGHVPWAEAGEGNPKVQAVKYFVRMLAEMRALGEGILIADQLPSALATEVIKNTSIKIMHRLTSEDDRKILGSTMVLNSEQYVRAVTLDPGESFLFREGWERPFHVLENDVGLEFQSRGVNLDNDVTDTEVAARMKSKWDSSAIMIEYDPILEMITNPCCLSIYVRAKELSQNDQFKLRANHVLSSWLASERATHASGGDGAVSQIRPHRQIRELKCVCAGVLASIAEQEISKQQNQMSEKDIAETLAMGLCLLNSVYKQVLQNKSCNACSCDASVKGAKISDFIRTLQSTVKTHVSTEA